MNILVMGNGGREHAFVKAFKKSPKVKAIYCASGNGGIAEDATCVTLGSHEDIIAFCRKHGIDFVVIGPEQYLVDGLADDLRAAHITVLGCSKSAAQLEASKDFTKKLCDEAGLPTAAYATFTNASAAKSYVDTQSLPIVLKADGLAAGKGVVIAQTHAEAHTALDEMFGGKFGEAGKKVVIEEFLYGEELSFFALCDGERAIPFGSAQDHKTAYDGDKGPNTGGMGTYSPAPIMTDALEKRVMDEIVNPTLRTMKARGTPFSGILFVGLMVRDGVPKLVEFNVRFGDPETQVVLMRLQDDLAEIFYNAARGALPETPARFVADAALCVVMAAKGYPDDYVKGTEINHIAEAASMDGVTIFHAGTKVENGKLLSVGGRVLGVTATAPTVTAAQAKAYRAVDAIDWQEGFCRRDIGWRAVVREQQQTKHIGGAA
jgi:phosphoribosylamine---glycine ligase